MDREEQLIQLKKDFRLLERNVLLLIAVPLSFFAFAYLYSSSDTLSFDLPVLPQALNYLGLSLVGLLLVIQQFGFEGRIKVVKKSNSDLHQRVKSYARATFLRYWQLFWVGIISALGLFFYDNPGFTVGYALTLVFVSLGKPTPHRIVTVLQLKKADKDLVYQINKRDE
jgi:hypothetical protein